MSYFPNRDLKLIGGRYDGWWWKLWNGERTINVRFMPPVSSEKTFDPNLPPMQSTVAMKSEVYEVGYIYTDSGNTKLAFGRPQQWSDGDALRHLFGAPL
jgi:hypothetical protein